MNSAEQLQEATRIGFEGGKAEAPAPAIGYSVTVDIAPGRQIVFQHFVEADEGPEALNTRLDRLMAVADRQRAKYEIPDIKAERLKMQDELAQMQQDMAEAEVRHAASQATLDAQHVECVQMKEQQVEQGRADYRKAGRMGSYTPQGHVKTNIERIEGDIKRIAEQKAKNEAERDQFLSNIQIGIDRRLARIKTLDEKLADLEAAVT